MQYIYINCGSIQSDLCTAPLLKRYTDLSSKWIKKGGKDAKNIFLF